jgi:hypothetical protein
MSKLWCQHAIICIVKTVCRFAALEKLNDSEDTNMAWENIQEYSKTSAKESLGLHELKEHKPWFDEECLGSLDQRKQAKMQCVQDTSQSNVDNLNSVRREVSRNFANIPQDYLQAKIDEIGTISDTCIGATIISRSVTSLELT